MSIKPDYLIIGTMKGGTTALNDFICKHPDVARSIQKEIHYFSLYPDKGMEWYLSHFPEKNNRIIGEASPTYFDVAYTQAIPRLIHEFKHDIKLILIIRDPLERAVSHYYHLKNINKINSIIETDINDFFDKPYESMLRQASEAEFYLHQIIDFSLYARKYLNFKSMFGLDQILTIGAWTLRSNPKETMNLVFDYLGLDRYYDPEFEQIKYSCGKTSDSLTIPVKNHLLKLFEPDFYSLCSLANINIVEQQ